MDMIKTKYDKMTREEKKALLNKYKKTEAGANFMKRLYHLRIIGVLSFLYSLGYFIIEFNHLKLTDYLMIIPLFLASILFLMMSYKLQRKVLIRFATKK